jgi:ribosomal protein S18 acetylase RimI-like enzyme
MTIREHADMIVEIPITFRVATREDVPRLEWFGQYTHFRNLIRRAFREQLRGRRIMLVADFNGFPIAQVFIQLQSTHDHIADGMSRAYLYSFRVMDLFQGRGIGTRLLQEAEALLMARGFEITTLSVAQENTDALRLYQRNGYRIVGQDPGRWQYVDQYGITRYVEEPCWVMEKQLS